MHNTTRQTLKNIHPVLSGIAVGSAGLGLMAALGAFAAADVSPAEPGPQFEMHSSAKVKFLAEPEPARVWTSDAWLSNCMGKVHAPTPLVHR